MKIYRNILFVFLSVTYMSCTDIALPEGEDKLTIEGELTPNEAISIELGISQVIGSKSPYKEPQSADVLLSGTGLQGEVGFVYSPGSRKFILRTTSFRPLEGGEYSILAFLPDANVDTILSITNIPYGMELDNMQIISSKSIKGEKGLTDTDFQVSLNLGDEEIEANYLHLIPSYSLMDSEGNIVEIKLLQIKNIVDKNAAFNLIHRKGFLVEKAKLSIYNSLVLDLSTDYYDSDLYRVGEIKWEVRNVTEDYFNYNEYIDRVKTCPSECHISDVSNIQNGLGCFCAYAVRYQIFPVN